MVPRNRLPAPGDTMHDPFLTAVALSWVPLAVLLIRGFVSPR